MILLLFPKRWDEGRALPHLAELFYEELLCEGSGTKFSLFQKRKLEAGFASAFHH